MSATTVDPRRATLATIERAFDVHTRARRIRGWSRDSIKGGWWVTLNGRDDLRIHTKRDALLLLAGLASAGFARDGEQPSPIEGVAQ